MRLFTLIAASVLSVAIFSRQAIAHQTSDSYLKLSSGNGAVSLRVEISFRDIEALFAVDTNHDGRITDEEIHSKEGEIIGSIAPQIAISIDGKLAALEHGKLSFDSHAAGSYAAFIYSAPLPPDAQTISLSYHLLFDHDAQHRGILSFTGADRSELTVLSPEKNSATFALSAVSVSWVTTTREFVVEGVWHIWAGYDHELFLLSLLFPAVLVREKGKWVPVNNFSSALWKILGIVTSFTVAHTLTLGAATLGLVSLPSRIVESAIAASVFVAALNNLLPLIKREFLITFLFGLVHGLGFASVLGDMQLSRVNLVPSLIGFNLGVELGQLSIVFAVMPFAYLLRDTLLYRYAVLRAGSVAVTCIASAWFIERVFQVTLLGF